MDIDDVLGRVAPARRTVPLCLDGSIAARLADAQEHLVAAVAYDANHNEPDTATAVRDEIAALAAEAQAATVDFVVQSIGAAPWSRLIAEHPPPDDEKDHWRWNIATFPPAALAASCVDPAMTGDQALELAERLTDSQWGKLWTAILAVNVGDDIPKFVPGIGGPPTSEPNSTTPAPEGSLTASSSANEDSQAPAS